MLLFSSIDGTELNIQRPNSLTKQSQCYSDYKSSTTLKEIVGIDPKTLIMFASMLFSGSVSDNEDYWQYILEEDGVLADKGFKVEKDIDKFGLRLNISPIAPASGQMKTSDVNMTESCYSSGSCREL